MSEIYDDLSQNDMLPAALEHVFGFIFITDGTGKIVYVSKRAAMSIGVSVEELLNMTCWDLEPRGLINQSLTVEAINKRTTVTRVLSYPKTGLTCMGRCTPLFDKDNELIMTVSYTILEDDFLMFLKTLNYDSQLVQERIRYLEKSLTRNVHPIMHSSAARTVFDYAARVASSEMPILLRGETGTGKDLIAHFIHQNSLRRDAALLPLNCSAIPRELIESELFGYEGGAFTGAKKTGKAGVFELANGGTLFLDEIGELPLDMQPKLLRVLEEGTVTRVGATAPREVDVRLIAATNRNLEQMVQEETFRADLYYRLNVVPIHLPPLRKRKDDILPLSEMFLEAANKKTNQNKKLSDHLKRMLTEYSWPGNIRELRNFIERLVITSPEELLDSSPADFLGDAIRTEPEEGGKDTRQYTGSLKEQVKQFEFDQINAVLNRHYGDARKAAKELGISRSGLYQKLKDAEEITGD
ncbi:MAG: sigma 54-interacting transcriptional regulator [Lachnospiraceae bacterium]|nr:sigma 54-interacting transcriptional regulator [Lachnospiraceae bacterium]